MTTAELKIKSSQFVFVLNIVIKFPRLNFYWTNLLFPCYLISYFTVLVYFVLLYSQMILYNNKLLSLFFSLSNFFFFWGGTAQKSPLEQTNMHTLLHTNSLQNSNHSVSDIWLYMSWGVDALSTESNASQVFSGTKALLGIHIHIEQTLNCTHGQMTIVHSTNIWKLMLLILGP